MTKTSVDFVLREKIRIGISACNFGAKVRWNHRGWDRVEGLGREKGEYQWTPVCPEVAAGLGVVRAPVRLVSGNGQDFWQDNAKMKNRLGMNVSADMAAGVQTSLEILKRAKIDAFVFMEGSPTCGVYRTTLKDKRLGKPPGVFGAKLLDEEFFLIPAVDLDSPWKWWDWSRRLHAFVWLKRQPISRKSDIYETWHLLKFICQEVDRAKADILGRELAHLPSRLTADIIDHWKRQVLFLIRCPSTLRRITATMEKHLAHYKKSLKTVGKDWTLPNAALGKAHFVDELKKWERQAFAEDYFFSGHPIIYKPER